MTVLSVLIFVFTFLIFFFSLAEIAVVSAQRSVILAKKEKGNIFASAALSLIDRADEVLGLIMLGSNISSISATAFITVIATRAYHLHEGDLLIVTGVQTVIFLLACEAFPKIISRFFADSVVLIVAFPLRVLLTMTYPVVKSSLFLSEIIKKKFSGSGSTAAERARDEIDALVRLGTRSGVIDKTRETYISEILSLHKITVIEALTPTINITSVEAETSAEDIARLISKSRFSRIPVYEKRVDNIVGYVYYRDVIELSTLSQKTAADLMTKAEYVPLTKSLYSLYRQMQTTNNYIVFAVNEFGAVVGMVTREDIAEEIVGEIQTRDHHRDDLIKKIEGGVHRISGSLDIDILARIFSIEIKKKGFETVSGFVSYLAGEIPREGSVYEYQGIVITVGKADSKMVYEILVKKKNSRRKR
jgi:CBS domain containing-hemolysin-like protein